ncbi:MAG: NAD(P) transhydrogenase subunit alpha [Bacteroidetes bacterium]|nr:MAG: NAD(P) transhydrogenase subunit alpha [Bacteroidota bacterium]
MNIGLIKESGKERRVALLPEVVAALAKLNVPVMVEKDAGERAFVSDEEYKAAGASIHSKKEVITGSGMIVKINPPTGEELGWMKEQQIFLGVLNPLVDHEIVKKLAAANVTGFSLDIIPRTSRAQAMDILSSMATVNGYKAVLTAANTLPKFFPMFMTAAGTITPAKVLILGAGVAGLQALATGRKLGGVVEVFDVRAAVKEEVTGLGGKFIDVEGATDEKSAGGYAVEQTEEFKNRQAQAIHEHAIKSDVIICTAQIPGKKAPVLLKKETVEAMKPGSVIIDIAASSGGNCELTKNGETVFIHDITIIGNSFFAIDMPYDASKMFGKNVFNFLKLMISPTEGFRINWEDDIVKGTCVTHNKEIINEQVKTLIQN